MCPCTVTCKNTHNLSSQTCSWTNSKLFKYNLSNPLANNLLRMLFCSSVTLQWQFQLRLLPQIRSHMRSCVSQQKSWIPSWICWVRTLKLKQRQISGLWLSRPLIFLLFYCVFALRIVSMHCIELRRGSGALYPVCWTQAGVILLNINSLHAVLGDGNGSQKHQDISDEFSQ